MQFGVYITMIIAGSYVITHPPRSFLFVLGDLLVFSFGGFLVLGGTMGAVAVLPGMWWLERMGVVALWTGLGMFAVIAISLGISLVGFLVSIALILSLMIRWRDIRKYEIAPREG